MDNNSVDQLMTRRATPLPLTHGPCLIPYLLVFLLLLEHTLAHTKGETSAD